ncbi:hypothetical protein LOC51_08615 [Rubrivivax sp. JA1024]|nr:hypothetical protein [Rubrivivax sp. JA1024]
MVASTNEIAALRKQFEEMSAKLAAMEGAQQQPAKPSPNEGRVYVERQAQVIYHAPQFSDPRMPNRDQLSELIKVVWAKYPGFAPKDVRDRVEGGFRFAPDRWNPHGIKDHAGWLESVEIAFAWQLTKRRSSIDLQRTIYFHQTDLGEFKLKYWRNDDGVGFAPMMTAIIAAGDILFLNPDKYYPYRMHLGLVARGDQGLISQAASWQRVLSTREAPEPSAMDLHQTRGATVRENVEFCVRPRF